MMKTIRLWLIFFPVLLFASILKAQVSDDFSDDDLTNNPAWQGDLQDFLVNGNEELQLIAPDAGESFLFTSSSFFDSTQWDLFFRLEFAPSGSNQLNVYLLIDNVDLTQANGYFLKIGESGNEDALDFYRLDDGNEILLTSGTVSALATDPATCRLQLSRDVNGNWTFLTDYSGDQNLTNEISFTDNTHRPANGFFGLHCLYTDSRKDKFFFDDFSIQPILPDTDPPVLTGANALDANIVELFFSETLDETSANQIDNYFISGGIGKPATAILNPGNPQSVQLSLSTPLLSPNTYTVEVDNISDPNGNTSGPQSITLEYITIENAQSHELLINEILADPSPSIGLPEYEFVEIFNPTSKIFNLANYQFQDGGANPILLPDLLIYPGDYFIICDLDVESLFAPFGKIAAINNFPALTNGGENLQITNLFGEVIDAVEYSDDWFTDPNKKEGGWTLERINPALYCLDRENWGGSENLTGGTPGRENSLYNPQLEVEGPKVLSVFPITSSEIRISFNQGMSDGNALDPQLYNLSPAIPIQSISYQGVGNKDIIISLGENLESGILYMITINPAIFNCTGKTILGNATFNLGLPEAASPGDILINEILYNPVTGGSDFAEFVNVSDKIIDISTLSVGNIQPGDTDIESIQTEYLVLPGDIFVLTPSRSNILDIYEVPFPERLLENNLPSLADDFGNLTIGIQDLFGLIVLDAVDYTNDWQHPLLDDENGVSLERISVSRASQDPSNWQSAASTVGYATPTGENSQRADTTVPITNDFILQPKTFSPDQDGRDDFLSILYQLDKSGYLCTITVFDVQGNEITSILKNELLALEGVLKWEGLTDDGEKAPVGIYVLHFQLTHPDGETREFQRTCVIATQLD